MKRKTYKSSLVMAMALMMFSAPIVFAGGPSEKGTSIEVGSSTEVAVQQGQELIDASVHQQSQQFIYAPEDNSSDTVIGSWVHPSASYGGLPDIPLSHKLTMEQWSEAPAKEIFRSLPKAITPKMIATYKRISKEELGDWDYKKMMKTIKRRSIIVQEFPDTDSIRPFPIMPRAAIAVEGVDYEKIGRIIIRTKKEFEAVREDLALLLCEAGMEFGATHFVPTGEGARRMFDTSSGGFSLLSAFAQVFATANPYGLNVSPGGTYSSGSNQTKTMPYLRVALVRAINVEKTELAMSPPAPVKAKTSEKKISRNGSGSELLNCPNPIAQNGRYRLCSASAEIDRYYSSEEQEVRELALVRARDDLRQAVRDGLKGEELKTAQRGLASTWWEMSKIVSTEKKSAYIQNAIKWTEASGEKNLTELKFYKVQLKEVATQTKQ